MSTINDQLFLEPLGYYVHVLPFGFHVYLQGRGVYQSNKLDPYPDMNVYQVDRELDRYTRLAWSEARAHFELTKSDHAKRLWQELGNVPVDDDGLIQERFMTFPEGTFREEIWQWFEVAFDVNLEDLMFSKEPSYGPF